MTQHPCEDCPWIGNDEFCWDECELDRELELEEEADEHLPEEV